jgi:ISXO2-like transposase domain/Transposase zinc-ribbon domain
MLTEFNSVVQLEKALPDEMACINYFKDLRWPAGVTCVHGCADSKIYLLTNGSFKCAACSSKFSVRNGTIFEDSKLPLRIWFRAIFLMISNPKGVSSMEIHRQLGITQKSAWFVVQRIRELTMALEPQPIMTGTVEIDETFIGGKEKWKHASKKSKGAQGHGSYKTKTAVLGMIERNGDLRIEKIASGDIMTSKKHVRKHVADGATVHTDEAVNYLWMQDYFVHESVNHRLGEYVRDNVTTNRIEGAFGHFKRAVHGVYHKVSDQHVDRYLGMFAFRWNNKKMTTGERTETLLKACAVRRLTYSRLIRKEVNA